MTNLFPKYLLFISLVFIGLSSWAQSDTDELHGSWRFQKLFCRQPVQQTGTFRSEERVFPFATKNFMPEVELVFSPGKMGGPMILDKKVMQSSCKNLAESEFLDPQATLHHTRNSIYLSSVPSDQSNLIDSQTKIFRATGQLLNQKVDYTSLRRCGGLVEGTLRALGAFLRYSPRLGDYASVEAKKEYMLYLKENTLFLQFEDSTFCPNKDEKVLMLYHRK